jgi:hypothetical protein
MATGCAPWGRGGGDLSGGGDGHGGGRFSIMTGFLPSLGAHSSRRHRVRRCVVSPYDPRYLFWEHSLVMLVFYSAWASPFEFGFLQNPHGPLAVADNVVNAFFAVDIVLTFFVAYADKRTFLLVDDPGRIAWRYVTTGFVLDVVSTVPTELSRRLLPPDLRSYGFFGMLRLWRLRRVGALFSSMEKDRRFSYFWVRCLKLIAVTIFAVHCAACFYYLHAQLPPRQHLETLRGLHVLVHHHPHHRRLRRHARRQLQGDALHNLLHVLQPRTHRIPHRKHDQPRRPRHQPHKKICK